MAKSLVQRTQVGRRVLELPGAHAPTEQQLAQRLARANERNAAIRQENAKLREENAATARKLEAIKFFEKNVGPILYQRIIDAGLGGKPAATEIANAVDSAYQAHVRAGIPLGEFGATLYPLLSASIATAKGGLAPAPKNASPLDALQPLPASKQEGRVVFDSDNAAREQYRRDAAERGRLLAEQNQKDRDTYAAGLKRLGLENPALGFAGTGRPY